MKQLLMLILLSSITASVVLAKEAAPPLVNYQGLLTDENGEPIPDSTRKLEFNIYDAPLGGTRVWGPQVFDGVPIVNGRFNVILGTTDKDGRSITDAFSTGPRFLSFKAGAAGANLGAVKEISPRQQILSAPYALSAERAGRVDFQWQNTDSGSIYFESTGDAAHQSNMVLETYDNLNEGFIFRNKRHGDGETVEFARIDDRGIWTKNIQSRDGVRVVPNAEGGNGSLTVDGQLIVRDRFNFNKFIPLTIWKSPTYGFSWNTPSNEETKDLGKHSFCALKRVTHDGGNGGTCDINFDSSSGKWTMSYRKWKNGGIECQAICF